MLQYDNINESKKHYTQKMKSGTKAMYQTIPLTSYVHRYRDREQNVCWLDEQTEDFGEHIHD